MVPSLSQVRTKLSLETHRLRFRLRDSPDPLDRDALVASLPDDPSVLLLCTGNICRSPLAERYLDERVDDDVTVSSAGIRTEDGRRSPTTAIDVAAEFGVDLTDHRSTALTSDQLQAADAVFVMDVVNYHHLRRRFGDTGGKTYFLGALDDPDEFEIFDPYGSGAERFRSLYGSVAAATDELAAALEER